MNIEQLGFTKWFLDRIDPKKLTDHQIAIVITVNKDSYTIDNGNGEVHAEGGHHETAVKGGRRDADMHLEGRISGETLEPF